jgi:hypothetical protein
VKRNSLHQAVLRVGALALVGLLLAACLPPKDRRAGLWLSGEEVKEPVTDWSFTQDAQEIFVETRTWYFVPHSVTTVVVAHGGTLYVPSIYRDGGGFPDGKYWNRNIVRDPRVRLQIGDKIYPRQAVLVTDPAEIAAVSDAFAHKFERWKEMQEKPETRPNLVFIRMDPRGA